MSRRERSELFVAAMREWFEARTDVLEASRLPLVWVCGGLTPSDDPVILYRVGPGEPLVGRRWDLDELASMFNPSDPASLAGCMWESQVDEPDFYARHLDVDWADLVADRPGEVLWLGPSPDPDRE